jgi:hypothetical protein
MATLGCGELVRKGRQVKFFAKLQSVPRQNPLNTIDIDDNDCNDTVEKKDIVNENVIVTLTLTSNTKFVNSL